MRLGRYRGGMKNGWLKEIPFVDDNGRKIHFFSFTVFIWLKSIYYSQFGKDFNFQ